MYAIAQHLVLSYCRKLKHVEALWFAGIANNILWWTFAKAAFNALLAKLGKRVTFKATLKVRNFLFCAVHYSSEYASRMLWLQMLCGIVCSSEDASECVSLRLHSVCVCMWAHVVWTWHGWWPEIHSYGQSCMGTCQRLSAQALLKTPAAILHQALPFGPACFAD